MSLRILVLLLLTGPSAWAGNSMDEISARCQPKTSAEMPLYANEFHWDYDLPNLLQKFSEIYHSPKRLPQRAYWDQEKGVLKLPYLESRGGDIEISEGFIKTIVRHVERAFELQYIDAVFFPDMGHSHLLIPQQLMTDKYDKYSVRDMAKMYREMFQDPQVEILYHTAEQLQILDKNGEVMNDDKLRWRHHTRNIVGLNSPTTDLRVLQNAGSKSNTVEEVPGYHWLGAGFNLSSNQAGCFEYRVGEKVFFFDLDMFDLKNPEP